MFPNCLQYWLVRCGLLGLVCNGAIALHAAPLVLAREIAIHSYDFAGKPVPGWSDGGLIAPEQTVSAEHVVHVFDPQGLEVRTILFGIPGARTIGIVGTSHNHDGSVALCGFTQDEKARLGHFLALVPPDDSLPIKVIRTDPYSPDAVAFGRDGTVWTKGVEYNLSTLKLDRTSMSGVIRHFDRAGNFIASFIPQSGLATADLALGRSLLSASAAGIGWHQGKGHSYFEVSPDGTVRQYPADPVDSGYGGVQLALTDAGEAVVMTYKSPSRRPAVYSLDRVARAWSEVQLPDGTGILLGSDGRSLVTFSFQKSNVLRFLAATR